MPGPVEPVNQVRREQLRALMTKNWWRAAMVLVPIAAGAVAAAAVSNRNPVVVFVLVAAGVALAGAIGTYVLADSRAKSAFLQAWARSRGWTDGAGHGWTRRHPYCVTATGANRSDHVSGPLGDDGKAVLCHYTYEVRNEHRLAGQQHHRLGGARFTVVETGVTAPGIPRLTLHPRSFGDNRLFDRIDTELTSNRVVQLESSELEHEYKLEVEDSASDAAVRLLFEPTFMVWCLDQAADQMLLEIENETLVVAIPDHSYDAAQLDDLVGKATTVATRLADARATTPNDDLTSADRPDHRRRRHRPGILFVVVTYNGMIRSRNMVDEGWSGIDVQLKRRHDLIPNLVEAVKGYAAHERETFQAVTDARTKAMSAAGPAASGAAESIVGQALGRLFAVAEAYPQLRATENFQQLQTELSNTEDQIAAARRIYNGNVQSYNTKIRCSPIR